jgi:hypothetical protein
VGRRLLPAAAVVLAALTVPPPGAEATPRWLRHAGVLVSGEPHAEGCRTRVCRHNENTDLTRWRGAVYLVHRTAASQVLGPNSSLRVYRSIDRGDSFRLQAVIPAPAGRDIRDPHFFTVGDRLHIKAITRLPGFAVRDTGANSVALDTSSANGRAWSPFRRIGPEDWTFWRVAEQDGTYYAAAYEDGNRRVVLHRSADGRRWGRGAEIYTRVGDSPSETELVFTPSGERMLALVRTNGTDAEVLGNRGRLRTKVCWARRPYARFACRGELRGVRLDGAVAFYWRSRLFVIARKHLRGAEIRKRTALYQLTGDLERGPLRAIERGELPSAGDTSYAGVARIGSGRFLASWYSSPPAEDPSWPVGIFGRTDIWTGELYLRALG